jgi:protein-L-isoaspartate(D-aspartate) O-methyltransferase
MSNKWSASVRGSAHKAPAAAEAPRARGAAVLHEGDWAAPTAPRLALIRRLREQGIVAEPVLAAIARIPRERFVDEALWSRAYEDTALPIGFEQTISQPVVVARMIEAILPVKGKLARVLEVGTGCGYQAAVLAQIATEVYSIERIKGLYERARTNLRVLRLPNVRLAYGDGYAGLAEAAPFDAIIVAAAAPAVPAALLGQLKRGGKLIAPVGSGEQQLLLVERRVAGYIETRLDLVRFVPMLPGLVK